jgi:hypothetical protein
MTTSDPLSPAQRRDLAARAAAVLRQNDLGGWTKAAPALYPHQWSWDSAFIAIGWAHLDVERAARELQALFRAQWATGMVPHIVFNPRATSYFPDPARWAASLSPHAPAGAATSGLCQPPVHAIAAHRIWETAYRQGEAAVAAADAFLRDLYRRLMAWHRYLATARDPDGTGLVTIYHPWESGTDNSPRWDGALAAVRVGDLPPYTRSDLQHVADPAERPTREEYDRYLWLVEVLKQARYDDAEIQRRDPFLVKDVLFSAILVAANEALLEIALLLDASDLDRATITGWIDRGRRGLAGRWHNDVGLCLDYDLRAGDAIRARTIAGFAPLLAGRLPADRRATLLATLDSSAFLGNADLRWPLPPSTSPDDFAFRPRSYWRGPVWPVMNWLYWWALGREAEDDRAARLKAAALAQLAGGELAEYYEPFTGEPLGSPAQSWTAAVVLDWLAAEGEQGT